MMRKANVWIGLVTGEPFHPFADRGDIPIEAIATGLASESRWAGQIWPAYTVAQHSLHVSRLAEDRCVETNASPLETVNMALVGMLHDAPEGLGFRDLPTPIKRQYPQYCEDESTLLARVLMQHRLPFQFEEMESPAGVFRVVNLGRTIEVADYRALVTEARDFNMKLASPPLDEVIGIADPRAIRRLTPESARDAWLFRFDQLTRQRKALES